MCGDMQNRPFADADEMDRVLIANYNSVVHKNDTVYLLGDILCKRREHYEIYYR